MKNVLINRWTDQIDQTTSSFLDTFGSLSTAELNWKASEEEWSVGQNIDHLMVINSTYFPILFKLRAGNYKPPFISKFKFLVHFLGKTVLNAVQADRAKKMKTFPVWEPQMNNISADILGQFITHQQKLKQEIELSQELIEAGAIISSPANKQIVYTLEMAFDIIVTHEQRHLAQSKEVLEQMNLSKDHGTHSFENAS